MPFIFVQKKLFKLADPVLIFRGKTWPQTSVRGHSFFVVVKGATISSVEIGKWLYTDESARALHNVP